MFPFFEVLGLKIYTTGVGIIFFLICFIVVSKYLCNRRHQDFYKLFYRLPIAIIITYIMGSYSHFALSYGLFPKNIEQLKLLISPYGYNFHFVGLLIGFIISLLIFFKNVIRSENKRIRADILFFSIALSSIPFGIFLLFGDNFVGKLSTSRVAVKPLTTQSELNKFGSVYPIGIFVSIVSIISVLITNILKKRRKKFGQSILGFIIFILGLNVVFLFQQYPKYGVIPLWGIVFDIKNYISVFVILLCLHIYYKRNEKGQ